MSSASNPVVPTTACTPLSAHHARFSRAASTTVKSTATSAPASASASALARDLEAACRRSPSWRRSMPGVVRIDGGDELELGVVEHRLADRGAHAPAGAEHADSDHRASRLTVRRRAMVRRGDRGRPRRGCACPAPSTRSITRRDVVGGDRFDLLDHLVERRDLAERELGCARCGACGSTSSRATAPASR